MAFIKNAYKLQQSHRGGFVIIQADNEQEILTLDGSLTVAEADAIVTKLNAPGACRKCGTEVK